MQNMRVFVSVQVTGLFLYVMLWADRKHMVARKSVYCLYSHGCACVWQWFLVCSWRLGASKICVCLCAGSETPDCVGVKCTDSWQTAAFPVILRSPPRLWPVMRLLRKILLFWALALIWAAGIRVMPWIFHLKVSWINDFLFYVLFL